MRKRHTISTMLALVAIVAVPLLAATPAEAGRRDKKNARNHKRQVVRQTHHNQRRVKLERQVTRRKAAPNRNVFEKNITRRRPTARRHEQRVVKLNKKVTNLGGERQKVQFDRTVARKPVAHHNRSHRRYGRDNYNRHSYRHNSYSRGHSRRYGYRHDRYPYRRHSNVSIGIGYDDGQTSARIYYGSGYSHYSRYGCGGGYYNRVWVQPVYETCYDDYGYSYSTIIRYGYYHNVWVAHTCDQRIIRY